MTGADAEDSQLRQTLLDNAAQALLLASAVLRPRGGRPGDELLRFGWPDGRTRVALNESVTKRGQRAEMGYAAQLDRADRDGNRRLQLVDFELIDLDGLDPSRVDETRQRMEVAAAAIPDLIVAADGSFLRIEGLERLRQHLAITEEVLIPPELLRTMERNVARFWDAWNGMWLNLDPAEMDGRERDGHFVLPGNVACPTKVLLQHAAEGERRSVLRAEARLGGEDSDQALAAALAEQIGRALPPAQRWRFHVWLRVECHSDTPMLRPHRVTVEQMVRILDPLYDLSTEAHEQHHYQFDWPER